MIGQLLHHFETCCLQQIVSAVGSKGGDLVVNLAVALAATIHGHENGLLCFSNVNSINSSWKETGSNEKILNFD